MNWTDSHGPDALYEKFVVTRVSTGEVVGGDEFVFVLRPERDEAACDALKAYADALDRLGRYSVLAGLLRARVSLIEEANAR